MIIYRIFLACYEWIIKMAAPFKPKARLWLKGRQDLMTPLAAWRQARIEETVVWMHCASLGEFEQGRSLLEQLKHHRPDWKIVLTFYSPSGYEIKKDYPLADYITYLPLDTPRRARQFVDRMRPDLAIFVKYEFWYYHLRALFERQIPTLLISAIFRNNQLFFRWYGQKFLRLLQGFHHIFVQDQASLSLLRTHGLERSSVAGDTRIDRSSQLPQTTFTDEHVAAFAEKKPVLVVGSSWPTDENILFDVLASGQFAGWRIIIAPHEIDESNLKQIETRCPVPIVRYTSANTQSITDYRVLLLDTIGMLSKIYRYGRIAYIGGGFGKGIHNTLEPAAYGLPVIFGPKYRKFMEAEILIATGGGFSIDSSATFLELWARLQNEQNYHQASEAAQHYIQQNAGATDTIIQYILNLQIDAPADGTTP